MGIEDIASRYGVEVLRVGSDHQAMMQARRVAGVRFVGGTRGGFIFPEFQTGADGNFAAVKILEMMAKARVRLSDLRRKFEGYYRQSVSVPCPWAKKGTVMRRLNTETVGRERVLVDGVRIKEDGGWVLITPDRLKASFNVLAESTSQKDTSKLIDRYQTLVGKWRDDD